MLSPAAIERWGTALVNPAFYQPMFAPMDLNWYDKRLRWMADPRSLQPVYNMLGLQSLMPAAPAAPAAIPVAPAPAAAAPAPVAPAPAPKQ